MIVCLKNTKKILPVISQHLKFTYRNVELDHMGTGPPSNFPARHALPFEAPIVL